MAVEVSCLFLKLSHFIHLSVAAVVFLGQPDLGFLAGDPVSLNLFSTFDTPDWVPPTLLAISHCLAPSWDKATIMPCFPRAEFRHVLKNIQISLSIHMDILIHVNMFHILFTYMSFSHIKILYR